MAKIKRKHLTRIGYSNKEAITLALLAFQHPTLSRQARNPLLDLAANVLHTPEKYLEHQVLGELAKQLQGAEEDKGFGIIRPSLRERPLTYPVFGEDGIEPGTLKQMNVAARLPVVRGGALMPDAHQGYGLPIGGVLATENAIIPYAVGVDIGCRMCLSVFGLKGDFLNRNHRRLKQALLDHTAFGQNSAVSNPYEDELLERSIFQEIPLVKSLHRKAARQIGSSGGGNHFVEFGLLQLSDSENEWGLPVGTYTALLSHSGSRGLGASIAQHYTRLAMELTQLPREAKHLAWLNMDREEGQEYWRAMNMAGDYASACHHHIHRRIARSLGEKPLFMVENHHNFAWKEQLADGQEVFVHRKGATPAKKGELGIIPGSMTAPGFLVRGKGNEASFNSASHGAGRKMSRSKAKVNTTRSALNKHLREKGVTLIGGGLDESPIAYKDIHKVMARQKSLVEVVGMFEPKIVRMAD
ncbi:MAG: RtcB family protein [Bacteroidota bacterium]